MSDPVLFLAEEKENEVSRKIEKEKCVPEQFYTTGLMTLKNICVII